MGVPITPAWVKQWVRTRLADLAFDGTNHAAILKVIGGEKFITDEMPEQFGSVSDLIVFCKSDGSSCRSCS